MRDLCVVGHYCHDTLIHAPTQVSEALGGSAAYISGVLDTFNADYSVVSRVGPDFRYLDQVSHPPRIVTGSKTTHFTAKFSSGERQLFLGAQGAPIPPEDLVEPARVGIAAGLIGEILPETLLRMTELFEFTICDIQGLIRTADHSGAVIHIPLAETPYLALMDRLFMIKASAFEAQFIDLQALRRRTRVIITDGKNGCTLYDQDHEIHVSGFPTEEVDPTGAGDCFMAGFAFGMVQGLPLDQVCRLANYFGAQAVAQVGRPTISPSLQLLVSS